MSRRSEEQDHARSRGRPKALPKRLVQAFIGHYNNSRLLQRHGHMTPARAREKFSRRAA